MTAAIVDVDPSARRLSEVARHIVIPAGIVDTLWFEVEERCREFGDEFDAWQDGLGQIALGLRDDGMFAATVGGVTLSIPRQVAKTFIVMRIVVALCTLFPGMTVVWTAHRMRTTTFTFKKMRSFVLSPQVRPFLRSGSNEGTAIRDANGEQEIPFKNGSKIFFGAREQGFGRGFDEVDIEVFDEAQILTERALEDMVAATNQSRFQHGALLFYMGTPPRPVDPGEVFTLRRSEALAHKEASAEFGVPVVAGDAVYLECSADRGADPEDEAQWARANPSFPHRTPRVSMLRLRRNLPAADSWKREALGIWDEAAKADAPLISPTMWNALATANPPPSGDVAYGVKFSADGHTVALSVGMRTPAGVHVEAVEHRSQIDGTRWLVDWLSARSSVGMQVVVDGKSGAGALVKALTAAKVPARFVKVPTVDEVITAHSMMLAAVTEGRLSHFGDGSDALSLSVAGAAKRPIGKSGGWGVRSVDETDCTVFESAILAHFAAVTGRRRAAPGAKRIITL